MDTGTSLIAVETILRVGLGLRILASGVSNVRRWPNPVKNAAFVFPFGATFFGAAAVFLMVAGGLGLALGLATPVAASMIALFLVPTLLIQRHWLKTLPGMIGQVDRAIERDPERRTFQNIARQAFHSHESGWQDNLLLLILALFFALRGSAAFGLDNLLR
ncbi:MAG TPA: DoxX family membrane protein [Candidatus Binatia bacterium]